MYNCSRVNDSLAPWLDRIAIRRASPNEKTHRKAGRLDSGKKRDGRSSSVLLLDGYVLLSLSYQLGASVSLWIMMFLIHRIMILALGTVAAAQSLALTLVERQTTTSSNQGSSEAPLLLPTFTTTTSLAQVNSTDIPGITGVDSNITTWAKHWGWVGCSDDKKGAVLQGLPEAYSVLGSGNVYCIDEHWHNYVAMEYLGSSYFATSNWHSQIKSISKANIV
ncbi:hypothetical protein K431DRAFT_298947 [Polychaeton citri CBS 116435]|uniref:Uncharacterized protein n=1 Tax=Polychaeton citri CBS 116435 TaxID=1314669 RepID=A0A9P4PYD0_9PEZI|nr:hypothetical protein K431DRAFT_298947 [Polychaeton citri CBS 116435]